MGIYRPPVRIRKGPPTADKIPNQFPLNVREECVAIGEIQMKILLKLLEYVPSTLLLHVFFSRNT